MRTEPLTTLFGETRRKVLGVLFSRPDEQFYLRELARTAGVAPGAIQRELARLTESGILLRSVRGNQVYYRANEECPIFAELVGLAVKTFGIADVLRGAMAPLADQIHTAFIYGSAARGELKSGSDIDLMVIGSASLSTIVPLLGPAQLKIGREINPTVYPIDEFCRKIEQEQHFVTTVVRETKIFLVGSERELAGLVNERLATRAPDQPAGDI